MEKNYHALGIQDVEHMRWLVQAFELSLNEHDTSMLNVTDNVT